MDIRVYVTRDGKTPFVDWLDELRDRSARTRIRIQLDRIKLGNRGDCKSLGHGLYELRIHYGPGYRVYFGKQGSHVVLLLLCWKQSDTADGY